MNANSWIDLQAHFIKYTHDSSFICIKQLNYSSKYDELKNHSACIYFNLSCLKTNNKSKSLFSKQYVKWIDEIFYYITRIDSEVRVYSSNGKSGVYCTGINNISEIKPIGISASGGVNIFYS